MAEAKHTAGDWHLAKSAETGVLYITSDNRRIADVNSDGMPAVESIANGDLIAASPCLLRLLQTILDVWDEHRIIGPSTYHEARAVIAKATP